jgi:peptidoglycan glycosyltransferase
MIVGPQALLDAANLFGIKAANPNTADALKDALPQAAYGQGQVVATPLQMARVAGSIVNQGRLAPVRIIKTAAAAEDKVIFPAEQAAILAQLMRRVVTEGTGSAASGSAIPIAGKTGTAEVKDHPSHAWFVGFAPYGATTKKVAFSILIENGRYGGRAAAPASVDIIKAAADAGLLQK